LGVFSGVVVIISGSEGELAAGEFSEALFLETK
jgi:hypothetical protein